MKPKTLILLAVAVGCGLVAMLGIQQAMQGGQTEAAPRIRVLVATMDIPPGVELTEENVEFIEKTMDSVPEDAVTSVEQYEERALKYAVLSGDIIRQSKLGKKGEFTKSTQIPEGMRVISIAVNDTHTLSGLLRPGDRVDLFVTYQARNPSGVMTTRTKPLLEYVEVFATDDRTVSDGAGRNQETKAKIVSLLVQPEHVPYIKLAESKGSLALSWRHPEDSATVRVADIDSDLLEELEGTIPMDRGRSPYVMGAEIDDDDEPVDEPDVRQFLAAETEQTEPVAVEEPAAEPVAVEQPEPERPKWAVEIFAGNDAIQTEFELPEEEQPAEAGESDASTAPVTDAFRWLHRQFVSSEQPEAAQESEEL